MSVVRMRHPVSGDVEVVAWETWHKFYRPLGWLVTRAWWQ